MFATIGLRCDQSEILCYSGYQAAAAKPQRVYLGGLLQQN
jgi:hypothetical protein